MADLQTVATSSSATASSNYDDLTVEEYLRERYSQLVCGLKVHTEELIQQLEEDFHQGKQELLQMVEIDEEDIEMYMKSMEQQQHHQQQQDSGSDEGNNEMNSRTSEMEVEEGEDIIDESETLKEEPTTKTGKKKGGSKATKQGRAASKSGNAKRNAVIKNRGKNGQMKEEDLEEKSFGSSDEEIRGKQSAGKSKRKHRLPEKNDETQTFSDEDINEPNENDPTHQNFVKKKVDSDVNSHANRKSSGDKSSASLKKLDEYRRQIDEISKRPTRVLLVVLEGPHKGNQYDLKRKLPTSPRKETEKETSTTTTKSSRRVRHNKERKENVEESEDEKNEKNNTTTFLIGRSKAKPYRVGGVSLHGDCEVSSEHGKIVMDEQGVATYIDMDSTNGSFYNEVQVEAMEQIFLKTGAKLRLGKSIMEVTIM